MYDPRDGVTPLDWRKDVDVIADATRAAVTALFREHPKDRFYYCALTTTGEVRSPVLTAWSWEALDAAVKERDNDPNARAALKWSYADSPFYCYGDQYFGGVRRLFDTLTPSDVTDAQAQAAKTFKMNAMVAAMKRLDQDGVFGNGSRRTGIVINVEFMPPDHSNVERARELNPPEALTAWLREAAEPR